MEHDRALAPGTTIAGRWRIERMLRAGGFGITYAARASDTGTRVAVKEYMPMGMCMRDAKTANITVLPGDAGEPFPLGLASFIKEAEALARLDHPAIVRVAGLAEANRTAYMALEFIDGGTLDDWLKALGRRPTQADVDTLLWPLLDALTQVHAALMLHRDIKPANIMVRADGRPVLIDFGAVKRIVRSETVRDQRTAGFYTQGYAAPEQLARGGEPLLGPWTDIYAMAATLYQIITGRLPPDADLRGVEDGYRPLASMPRGTVEVGHARPWNMLEPGWRVEFLAGIDKALALKRSDRPQSAVEFRRELGVVEPVRAAPQPRRSVPPPTQPAEQPEAEPVRPQRPVTFGQIPPSKPAAPAGNRSGMLALFGVAALLLIGTGGYAVYVAGHREGTRSEAAARNQQSGDKAQPAPPKTIAVTPPPAQSSPPVPVPPAPPPRAEPPPRPVDPISALVPGSGQSARDRLADGGECAFCPEMVVVPAGSLLMGSTADEIARVTKELPDWKTWFDAEGPQHRVAFAKPFAIGKFEVTFAEWDACADAKACSRRPEDQGWGRGRQPVINVSWDEITKEYLPWLSRTTGRTYRLLTEAEWEYAARATTTTRYGFGDAFSNTQANNDKGRTVLVGQYPANLWGLHDMHGNVWEWVQDCYTATYNGAPTDGSAGAEIASCRRVVRGGSWGHDPQNLRSANRIRVTSDVRGSSLGFRLARTLNP